MIRRAVSTRFDRPGTAGRNIPLLVAVEANDGAEHEVLLRASGRPELGIEGLARTLTHDAWHYHLLHFQ